MGWRGALRSLAAAARQAERESRRRQKELERRQREIAKMEELAQASYEVELYENRIELLTSIHKDCGNAWDWEKIKATSPPVKPSKSNKHEDIALSNLQSFRPSITDKIFGRVEPKLAELSQKVDAAKKEDEQEYTEASKIYEEKYSEWQEICELSTRILNGDAEAYIEAIKQIKPFSEISEIGSSISFDVVNRSLIDLILRVNSEKVIPSEIKTVLKSGKLSVKKMPKSKFYELYQDYVCCCIFRVARELFALLPIEVVIISGVGKLLNTSTGFMEDHPILSAVIPKETLNSLNFDSIDPSDALSNFIHRMNFKKMQGFSAIKKIKPFELKT